MKSLFGEEISDTPPDRRRTVDRAHPAPPGSGPDGMTCGDCAYLVRVPYRDYRYIKCSRMIERWTHGRGSDIRLKDLACREFKEGK